MSAAKGPVFAHCKGGTRALVLYTLGEVLDGRMKAGADIGIVLPRDYTLVLSRAAFIPKSAQNPAEGAAFLDYLLSLRGQQVALQKSFFFAQGSALPDGIEAAENPAQSMRPIAIGPDLLAVLDRQKRMRLLREWGQSLDDK